MPCRGDEEVLVGDVLLPEQRGVHLAALLVLLHGLGGGTRQLGRVGSGAGPVGCHRRRNRRILLGRSLPPLAPLLLPTLLSLSGSILLSRRRDRARFADIVIRVAPAGVRAVRVRRWRGGRGRCGGFFSSGALLGCLFGLLGLLPLGDELPGQDLALLIGGR